MQKVLYQFHFEFVCFYFIYHCFENALMRSKSSKSNLVKFEKLLVDYSEAAVQRCSSEKVF